MLIEEAGLIAERRQSDGDPDKMAAHKSRALNRADSLAGTSAGLLGAGRMR